MGNPPPPPMEGWLLSMPNVDEEYIDTVKRALEDKYSNPSSAGKHLILRGDARMSWVGTKPEEVEPSWECLYCGRPRRSPNHSCPGCGASKSVLKLPEPVSTGGTEVEQSFGAVTPRAIPPPPSTYDPRWLEGAATNIVRYAERTVTEAPLPPFTRLWRRYVAFVNKMIGAR